MDRLPKKYQKKQVPVDPFITLESTPVIVDMSTIVDVFSLSGGRKEAASV